MHVPHNNWVVWVAGVVVLGVDFHAVSIWIAQVEVESIGDAVATRAALDGIRLAQRTELVTDSQDVVLFVRSECDVVHTWAIAAGHGGVVHGWLAAHPRSISSALVVADCLGDAEAQVFHVLLSLWHIWGDLVEVVQANQSTWAVELIAPSEALYVVDFVEELIWEAQWVFHADGVTDALDKAILVALGAAA